MASYVVTAIQVRGLTKRRRRRGLVVDDVSFDVQAGRVCALLGPNGSGKTTILRMMIGLATGSGSTLFHGRPFGELRVPRRHVGVAIAPAPFNVSRRVAAHLGMVAAGTGVAAERVDAVLEATGLTEHRRTPIKALSLGLKQRLSLATALIGDPATLLLDEPTNGLDPAGAVWFRDYLRVLAGQGKAVLVSSHYLLEADAYAQDAVILDAGRVRASGPISALRAMHGADRAVRIGTTAPERLAELIGRHGGRVVRGAGDRLRVEGLAAGAIGDLARANDITLEELRTEAVTLEHIFRAVCAREGDPCPTP